MKKLAIKTLVLLLGATLFSAVISTTAYADENRHDGYRFGGGEVNRNSVPSPPVVANGGGYRGGYGDHQQANNGNRQYYGQGQQRQWHHNYQQSQWQNGNGQYYSQQDQHWNGGDRRHDGDWKDHDRRNYYGQGQQWNNGDRDQRPRHDYH